MQLSQSISSTYRNSKFHLLKAFCISTFNSKSILVVSDESNGFITFRHNPIESVLRKQTSSLVDIDRNVIQSCCFSCHLEALVVHLQSLLELFLLQELISFFAILVESNVIELNLNDLKNTLSFSVCWFQKQKPIEISLGFLNLAQIVVALGSSEQDLNFQSVIVLERLCLVLEIVDQLKRLG